MSFVIPEVTQDEDDFEPTMALPFQEPAAAPAAKKSVSFPLLPVKKTVPKQRNLFGKLVNTKTKTVHVKSYTRNDGTFVSACSRTISTKQSKPTKFAAAKSSSKHRITKLKVAPTVLKNWDQATKNQIFEDKWAMVKQLMQSK